MEGWVEITVETRWPNLVEFWLGTDQSTGMAIHSNGRIEVGPLTMNG